MAANQLELSNVINISVSQAQAGVLNYNTSNLAIFTEELPAMSFGSAGYAAYLSPTQVGVDFGTSSKTYAMAVKVFGQQPNILANNGQLVVILMTTAIQNLALSGVAASGTFILNYGGNASSAINWNDTASQIQVKVRLIPGLETATVTGSIASQSLHVNFISIYGTQSLVTVTSNSLATVGPVSITFTITTLTAGETWGAAITRTKDLVQYFGLMATVTADVIGETPLLAAGAIIQALNKVGVCVGNDAADVDEDGLLDLIRQASLSQLRALYYGDSDDADALGMMAAYAGRAFSVNFGGSNTTMTMHLKDLTGVLPDPTMTQTILDKAIAAGADTYASLQGVSKVFCSGENSFFDQVYNLQWFVGALQVAGFNYLAQSSTKIPQTESGMDGLKGAYRAICQQAVSNQYVAPGTWNSADTFGNQADLLANIGQVGYYIYSAPISQQSQADRAARQAPLIQIAIKEAGAIQSSTVIVYVNA